MASDPINDLRLLAEADPAPVDQVYRLRVQERQNLDALRWLANNSEAPEPVETPKTPARPEAPLPDRGPPEGKPMSRTAGEVAMDVLRDVGGGVLEGGTQALGGAIDAANAMVDQIADLSGFVLGSAFPELRRNVEAATGEDIGGILPQIDEKTGKISPPAATNKALAEAGRAIDLPTTSGPKTVTGGAIRSLSQFLTGFAMGRKVTGGGTAAKDVAAGVIADFAAFDGHEERLSDFIQSFPELQNPVTEFLASDEEDSEVVGRLKNVLEGVAGDAVFAGVLRGLRAIKEARRIRAQTGQETFAEAAKRLSAQSSGDIEPRLREAGDLRAVVGDPEAPALEIREIDAGVPDQVLAAGGTPRGLSRVPLGEREVFINFARINTPEDVKRLVADMADAFKEDIGRAARDVRTNKQTIKAAGDENAWKLLSERRMGEPLNAEQTLAVRNLWAASGDNLSKLAKEATQNPSPENLFAFRRAFALHATIQKEAIAVRTETARALQQWAIPAGGGKEIFRDIESVINVHGGAEVSEDLARRIAFLAEQGNQGAIDHMARKGASAATLDAVQEYWINGLLSGPKTHLVNVLSNTSVALLSAAERALAERIGDMAQGAARTQVGESGAMLHGLMASSREAFLNAWQSLKTGQSGFGISKLEGPRIRAISTESLGNTRNETFNRIINQSIIAKGVDLLGSVVTVPGRFLTAEDEFFKTINYRMEVHAQAFRQASQEVESGTIPRAQFKARLAELVDNPPEAARLAAQDFAAYNTFTKDPGEFVKNVQRMTGKYPALRFVVPFINTPANIIKFTFERTPFAPLSARIRADIAAGGARRDMAMARIGLGSMAMMTAYDLGMNGQVTGGGPSDFNEKTNLRRQGWQPYSVKVGNRYYAYNRLDPVGFLVGMGADLAEYSLNTTDDPGAEYEEAAVMAIFSAAENLTEKTYLYGFSQLLGALNDPGRFATRYAERFAGSFVPTGVAEVARLSDPQMKHATSFMDKIKSRLPGLSQDVPNRHDLWGRPISFQSGLGKAYDAISPIYSSEFKPEPADREMERLGLFKSMPSKSVGIRFRGKTERISLRNSPKIYERYVVLSGGTPATGIGRPLTAAGSPSAVAKRLDSYGEHSSLSLINAIVAGKHDFSADYAKMTDDEKADFLSGIINDYRAGARETIKDEFPELREFRREMELQ